MRASEQIIIFNNSSPLLPLVAGTQPTLYANFSTGIYFFSGSFYSTFSAWLTAISGTFSRSSSATYISSGVVQTALSGVARFPTGQGIRLTGSGTNLYLHSAISDSVASYIVQHGSLTANAGTDPSGGSAAASFIPDTSALPHLVGLSAGVNQTSSTQYVFSVFAKQVGPSSYFSILDSDNSLTNYSIFTLASGGSVVSNTGNAVGSITALANGWFLLSVAYTAPTTGNVNPVFEMCDGTANRLIAGDGTSGWLLWGFQYTQSSFLLDYIPTTTATVTQAADSLTFPFTQRTFSGLFGTNGISYDGTATQRALGDNNNAGIYVASATQFSAYNGSASLAGPTVTSVAGANKAMIAGNGSNTWVTADSLTPSTSAIAINTSAPTTLALGSEAGTANFAGGNYTQLAIWNGIVASTSDMQRLTT